MIFHQKVLSAFGILCLSIMACNVPGVPVTTTQQVITPSLSASETTLKITGTIWHDLCAVPNGALPDPLPVGCTLNGFGGAHANGIWEADEPGIPDITVSLYANECGGAPINSTTTDANGAYFFNGLSPIKYCVTIDSSTSPNDKILTPGEWTYPASATSLVVFSQDLLNDKDILPINFGWDYQYLPESSSTTPIPVNVPSATAVSPPTPVPSISDTTPPTIGEVSTLEADVYYGNPLACGSSGTVTIEAYINDASGVASTYIKYRYISSGWNGDLHTLNFTYQAGTGLNGFTIPAGEAIFELVTDDGYIQYTIYAIDAAGNTAVYPSGAGAPVAIPIYYCP